MPLPSYLVFTVLSPLPVLHRCILLVSYRSHFLSLFILLRFLLKVPSSLRLSCLHLQRYLHSSKVPSHGVIFSSAIMLTSLVLSSFL